MLECTEILKVDMVKNKRIYYLAIIGLVLLYALASAAGYETIALIPILLLGCWVIWKLRPQ
jgi:hypothetical protein